ncbi:HAMP domain-containing sensor histidine kinase [Frankia sp. Cas4]|uniref:sensor histidine kinase n=1 Tax=Frankia sp. Cas4 TaxID=3073927 RepID=UPI002AD3C168|nr:HAMP domain-containing sensor histidine kinase [Frankia sp. Cas4]
MTAFLEIAGIALGCSLAAPLLALPLLRLRVLWRASVRIWGAAVVVVGVCAMAAGVAGTAEAMFLSNHDLDVVLIVLAVSAVAATTTTLLLGRPVARASVTLTDAAGHLGEDGYRPSRATPPTAELAAIARALDDTHVRLVAARERERALEASRRELVAWVSHDLRTPIAGIRATAEALDDGVVTDAATVARYHRTMVRACERLTTMVDDLFELSRLHAGTLELTLERVALSDVISDAVAAADPLARAKGVLLHGDADNTAKVEVDVAEVGRVLTNLLVNAIRHTPSDGTVAVTGQVSDRRAVLAVADSCGGIPDADLGRLFETGYRGETARTPRGLAAEAGTAHDSRHDSPHDSRQHGREVRTDQGSRFGQGSRSGLGLAIVRGIVEAHGGDVTVHNIAGGCRFVVALPLTA